MSGNPDWYRDEELLLGELNRGGESVRSDRSTESSPAWRGASGESRLEPPPIARTPKIAGYEAFQELRRGGQGIVYTAVQRSTQRTVAIKVLLAGAWAPEKHKRRFQREIKLIASLQHPNIVRLYDSGLTSEGYPYYVMEFIEGVGLDELIAAVSGGQPWVLSGYEHLAVARGEEPNRRAPSCFATRSTLALMAKVCEAVGYAHQHGMIHRDVKPSNIRVDTNAEPHVLDFGLAKHILGAPAGGPGPSVSLTGEFMGSLAWASPEQTEGVPERIDARADVYALGVILFQMLTGQFPYPVVGGFQQVLDRIKSAEPPRPSSMRKDLDDEVDTILLKCLAKEPERRYRDADELAREIRRYLAGEPIEAKHESVTYRLRKRISRHRTAFALTGALVAVGAVSVASTLTLWRSGYWAPSAPRVDPVGVAGVGIPEPNDDGLCRSNEVLRLRPDGVKASDMFGESVAISGEPWWRIAIGAPYSDDLGANSGAAYIYRFDGQSWIQEAKLLASDGTDHDWLAWSLALDAKTLLIGADLGDGNDERTGAAYVFDHDGAGWVEQIKLIAPDGERGDEFGYAVALQDDTAVAAAFLDDDNGRQSGSAYVFRRSDNGTPEDLSDDSWAQEAKLLASDGEEGNGFGYSVALQDDLLVVGARGAGRAEFPGAAYVFRRDADAGWDWREEAKLVAPNGELEDAFGCSVAIDGDVIVVGARYRR
ncbi:MAG: protein kinase domain-containing protein, partial [Planctomycetota bacterium]